MSDGLTLDEWLVSTAEKRQLMLDYAKSMIPNDPGERHQDVSKALDYGQDAGDLLADVEQYLAVARAVAVVEARKEHDAKTALVVADSKVAHLARLRDGLAVLYRTLKDRRFSLMNLNRA